MAIADSVPWLVDLYLVVGVMLVVILVPKLEQAVNEYWLSTENAVWTRALATIVVTFFLMRSCA
jgi:hypothetical protein